MNKLTTVQLIALISHKARKTKNISKVEKQARKKIDNIINALNS